MFKITYVYILITFLNFEDYFLKQMVGGAGIGEPIRRIRKVTHFYLQRDIEKDAA